jgi:hypothetical protein
MHSKISYLQVGLGFAASRQKAGRFYSWDKPWIM